MWFSDSVLPDLVYLMLRFVGEGLPDVGHDVVAALQGEAELLAPRPDETHDLRVVHERDQAGPHTHHHVTRPEAAPGGGGVQAVNLEIHILIL